MSSSSPRPASPGRAGQLQPGKLEGSPGRARRASAGCRNTLGPSGQNSEWPQSRRQAKLSPGRRGRGTANHGVPGPRVAGISQARTCQWEFVGACLPPPAFVIFIIFAGDYDHRIVSHGSRGRSVALHRVSSAKTPSRSLPCNPRRNSADALRDFAS